MKIGSCRKFPNFALMVISTYISDLLYRYECVILPGFGAFLTRNQSAWIDEESNNFFPPSKVISFNRQLQANDGLLANYIASVEKCSYELGLKQVRNFSNRLLKDLDEGKVITFKNIGSFSKNKEGSIQFSPQKNKNYNTAAFGLTSITSSKIHREVHTEEVATSEKEPIAIGRTKRPYLKYAAVAAVALLATGFGGMKFYENQVEEQNLAERQKAHTLVENHIQEATFVIGSPLPAVNLHLSKHTGNYHIVAGAFRVEENAEKKMDQLREKGYSPRKLTSRYGLHQILYESFENRREAVESLHAIQQTQNANAWLLVQEID